jgi:hypothetical protein
MRPAVAGVAAGLALVAAASAPRAQDGFFSWYRDSFDSVDAALAAHGARTLVDHELDSLRAGSWRIHQFEAPAGAWVAAVGCDRDCGGVTIEEVGSGQRAWGERSAALVRYGRRSVAIKVTVQRCVAEPCYYTVALAGQ